jgi:hypothetical protein
MKARGSLEGEEAPMDQKSGFRINFWGRVATCNGRDATGTGKEKM